jgi:hypothetical protein
VSSCACPASPGAFRGGWQCRLHSRLPRRHNERHRRVRQKNVPSAWHAVAPFWRRPEIPGQNAHSERHCRAAQRAGRRLALPASTWSCGRTGLLLTRWTKGKEVAGTFPLRARAISNFQMKENGEAAVEASNDQSGTYCRHRPVAVQPVADPAAAGETVPAGAFLLRTRKANLDKACQLPGPRPNPLFLECLLGFACPAYTSRLSHPAALLYLQGLPSGPLHDPVLHLQARYRGLQALRPHKFRPFTAPECPLRTRMGNKVRWCLSAAGHGD